METSFITKYTSLTPQIQMEVAQYLDFLLQKKTETKKKKTPKFGSAKGKITMAPDFDEPLEDFKPYME